MKKIPTKILSYLIGGTISLGCLFGGFSSANMATFSSNLAQAGISVSRLAQQSSIPRFEIARLLNAVNCEDCLVPAPRMVQKYNLTYWTDFSNLSNRDFDDVAFKGAPRNKKSYYYCVAYVGDREYMKGYPIATSPICGGKFCGQNNTTKSEFFQSVLNIIQGNIRSKYTTNRGDIKNWFKALQPGSYQYQVLNAADIQTLNNTSAQKKDINSSAEFQVYLKYCMFNISKC